MAGSGAGDGAGGGCRARVVAVFRRLDLAALGRVLKGMRWGWYLAAQGVFALGLLGSAFRWHLMLRLNHEAVVHGAASVRMVFLSQFFNTLFGGPSGGDVPKTAFYSRWFRVRRRTCWRLRFWTAWWLRWGDSFSLPGRLALGRCQALLPSHDWNEWNCRGAGGGSRGGVLLAVVLAVLGWWVQHPDRPWGCLGIPEPIDSETPRLEAPIRTCPGLCGGDSAAVEPDQIPVPPGREFGTGSRREAVLDVPGGDHGGGHAGDGGRGRVAGGSLPGAAGRVRRFSPAIAVAGSLLTLSVHLTWALVGAGLFSA